uniref:uridine diphosphate glucose pyrophosphatase isoform X2 n=1 Tax=Podarcis muralis TaxID=64176 RepID=UPI00109F1265|nr:uridine diphosphate glucose pyrophosphatase isoform X2 [Podarcis muralis]
MSGDEYITGKRRTKLRKNGISKKWDFMRTHDRKHWKSVPSGVKSNNWRVKSACFGRRDMLYCSVAILIFNTSRRCFVVVKQFRPAVYMCEMERLCPQVFERENQGSWCPLPGHLPPSTGVTYELCAGIVDKPELSLEETACMEVLEECGYEIPTASLKKITSCRSGVGVSGSKQTLFYAEVTDEMKAGEGGGQPQEGELIEVVEIPLQDCMTFAFDEALPKTMGFIFSFMWFQTNVVPKLLEKE